MFQITINEKGGPRKQLDFDKSEVTIGRVQGNDVVLPKGNISKRHSRIVVKDGKFIIIDMQSTNGTYVNGKKITTPQVIKASDKIYIGDFTLQLESGAGAEDAGDDAPAADSGQPKRHGLIDENFDQEFEGAEDDGRPKAPSRAPERESSGAELELELGAPEPEDDDDEEELDLGGGELELDDEPEPEPKRASVVPMKPSSNRRSAAPSPSRVKPGDGRGRSSGAHENVATSMPSAVPAPMGGMPMPVAAMAAVEPLERKEALAQLHQIVVDELELASTDPSELSGYAADALRVAQDHVRRFAAQLPAGEDLDRLATDAAAGATDLGVLQGFIQDQSVHEIVVTHHRQVFVDREGRLEESGSAVAREADVVRMIRALAVMGGHPAELVPPLVDVRLRDGARVIGALPPTAFRGPTLSYRKSSRDAYSLEDFVTNQQLNEPMMKFLDLCVRYRQGVLLSVGPGVSPSATLNALASLIPADERIVTIETGVELHLGHVNVTALDPVGGDIGQLVRYAVSVQPDRALIGHISGSQAFDVLNAMCGALEGAVTCYSAESPEQAVDRLARVEVADKCASLGEAKRLVASAIKIVLQEERLADGLRRITKISEVSVEGDNVSIEDIFTFEPEGLDDNNLITGAFRATGTAPQFLVDLQDQVDMSIFES